MYRKLLVGYRDTEDGRDALALGKMLARATDAAIMVASVVRSRSQVDEAESVLRNAVAGTHRSLHPKRVWCTLTLLREASIASPSKSTQT